jgi:hypothetical protein
MRHATALLILGLMLVGAAWWAGAFGLIAGWLGVDFLLLGGAHLRGGHGVFGKRANGTLPLWSWMVFLPLFLLTLLVWHLARLFSGEPAFHRVSPHLVVGRRLFTREKPGGFANYVDLTAEFAEPREVREAPEYVAFPLLDASAPSVAALRGAVAGLRPGPTFIHCAQGHGRTGLFALAVLLESKTVQTVDEGLAKLTEVRPGIRLSASQEQCIRVFAGEIS